MTREEAQALVKKHGTAAAAARAAGVAKQTFSDRLLGKYPPRVAPTGGTRSLADFRAQYDKATIVPRKVREALHQLGAGWAYEVDFARRAGVSLADLGRFRDQFAAYVVQIGRDSRRAWAGSAATARAMREMLA